MKSGVVVKFITNVFSSKFCKQNLQNLLLYSFHHILSLMRWIFISRMILVMENAAPTQTLLTDRIDA